MTFYVDLVGDDTSLLEHMQRCTSQMLASVQEVKASSSCMPSHPCSQLERLKDGFGNSLKRAKPFIEKGCGSTRSKSHKENLDSFPVPPKRQRVTMQGALDLQAMLDEESD